VSSVPLGTAAALLLGALPAAAITATAAVNASTLCSVVLYTGQNYQGTAYVLAPQTSVVTLPPGISSVLWRC
jgi:hypothetical protein